MIVFIGTSLALMPLTFLAARNWRLLAGLVEFYFREKFELTGRTPRARVLPILIHIPVQLFFPNVLRQWKIIEEVVLPGDDAIVEKFKLSYLSDCSMTSVAVCPRASPSAPKKNNQVLYLLSSKSNRHRVRS